MREINKKVYEVAGQEVPESMDQLIADGFKEDASLHNDDVTKEHALKHISDGVENIYGKTNSTVDIKAAAPQMSSKRQNTNSQIRRPSQQRQVKNSNLKAVKEEPETTKSSSNFINLILVLALLTAIAYYYFKHMN